MAYAHHFPVSKETAKSALIDQKTYHDMYEQSMNNPEEFWDSHGQRIDWFKPYETVKNTSFDGDVSIKWYEDGTLNACYNAVDRHLKEKGNKTAIIWQADSPDLSKEISYNDLHTEVCRMANSLKSLGVKKGDRVTIYLPMIPEAAYAMLACARIGAVHSVVFAGFSPSSLAGRINDCDSKVVITADAGLRGGKIIPLKQNADEAAQQCPNLEKILVVRNTKVDIPWNSNLDICYEDLKVTVSAHCPCEEMSAEDPLFVLYTSGSTGKPKGVLHTTGGYMVYASLTHQYVFDLKEDDIYWCTADVGWITGHSYLVYGPLANGATTLMFEGVPNYPDFSRFWQIVDKFKVSLFYTAPTAIRALMREGDTFVAKTDRSSLRVLGSVGEPINPEAWLWYYNVVGEQKCPIVDTWWQTETGGILITPLIGATTLKPGSATRPFFGVNPILVDNDGTIIEGEGTGNLCINESWPGQMRTIYGDHERFIRAYFSAFKGKYFSGDECYRDQDGYYWITGRVDDILNISGHRMGTAEIESALVAHPDVSEAAVVGFPHDIKGQGIYCYVSLTRGHEATDTLKKDLIQWVRKDIGPIATPDIIQWAPDLPKTRSGKIMRRILRKIAENNYEDLGDTSTLADPEIVKTLIAERAAPA